VNIEKVEFTGYVENQHTHTSTRATRKGIRLLMTLEPTVLIIDDSATSCHIMEGILQKEGCRVKVARDGRAGVQMVLQEVPHCVVLDVVLPGMSGYEVCRYLRSQVTVLRDLPIIMVSTKNTPVDKTWALRQGATHYLAKPFDEREFIKLVKESIASYVPPGSVEKTNQQRGVVPRQARQALEPASQERLQISGKMPAYRPVSTDASTRKPHTPSRQDYALHLYKLIPVRNQGADFMWGRSPHFLSTINPQARLLYNVIDGKQDIETLCRTTQMSQEDVMRALRTLLVQHRVRLLEPGGQAASNVNLEPPERRSNQF
jgi:CheY-like chemotaxis protein